MWCLLPLARWLERWGIVPRVPVLRYGVLFRRRAVLYDVYRDDHVVCVQMTRIVPIRGY